MTLNFDALQTALNRAEKLNYMTATIAVIETKRQDEFTGWSDQSEIDYHTSRLNDLPDNKPDEE